MTCLPATLGICSARVAAAGAVTQQCRAGRQVPRPRMPHSQLSCVRVAIAHTQTRLPASCHRHAPLSQSQPALHAVEYITCPQVVPYVQHRRRHVVADCVSYREGIGSVGAIDAPGGSLPPIGRNSAESAAGVRMRRSASAAAARTSRLLALAAVAARPSVAAMAAGPRRRSASVTARATELSPSCRAAPALRCAFAPTFRLCDAGSC
jgi:hypothetical protein